MTNDEIADALEVPPPQFPEIAIRAAEERGAEMREALLRLLERSAPPAVFDDASLGSGHIFAMLLLARMADETAFDPVVRWLARPPSELEGLLGDFLVEDLARVLASLAGGEIDRLVTIVRDPAHAPWVRVAALTAITAFVARGTVERATAADTVRALVAAGMLEDCADEVVAGICHTVLDLHVDDLFETVRTLVRRGRFDPFEISLEDVDDAEHGGVDTALQRLRKRAHLRPVQDVVTETSWWVCWRQDDDEENEGDRIGEGMCDDPDCLEHGTGAHTVRRTAPKIGRNDPCPCGSGRKYKKCCLAL